MGFLITLVVSIFLILGIVVGTQNGNTVVEFYFLKWHFEKVSLSLLLIEAVLVGIVVAVIIAAIGEVRLRANLWRVYQENKKLKEELRKLKELPLEEEKEEM